MRDHSCQELYSGCIDYQSDAFSSTAPCSVIPAALATRQILSMHHPACGLKRL